MLFATISFFGLIFWKTLPVMMNGYKVLQEGQGTCTCATQISFFSEHPFAAGTMFALFLLSSIFFVLLIAAVIRELLGVYRFSDTHRFALRKPSKKLSQAILATALNKKVFELSQNTMHVFCAGLLKPRIYVSSAFVRSVSPNELKTILLHEKRHLLDRDPLRLFFAHAAAQMFFLVPFIDRTVQDFKHTLELAADEYATQSFREPRFLGSALLKLLGRKQRGSNVPIPFLSTTELRVQQLLSGHVPSSHFRKRVPVAIAAVIVIVGLFMVQSNAIFAFTHDGERVPFSSELLLCPMRNQSPASVQSQSVDQTMTHAYSSNYTCQTK